MTKIQHPAISRSFKALSRTALLGSVMVGALSGCGPTEQAELDSTPAARAAEAVAVDAQDVVRRARARLPLAQAASSSAVISPELSTRAVAPPPWIHQTMPSMVAGNGMYLVVWTEVSTQSGPNSHDVFATRVNASTGALLDSEPIHLGLTSDVDVYPAAGFDGTNFLIAWSKVPFAYAARVRASDGALLDTPRNISNPPPSSYSYPLPHMNPAIAFDGTSYLVVWNGAYGTAQGGIADGILGAWVDPATGMPHSGYSFIISPRQGTSPKVAYGGGRYLVTWSDSQNGETHNVYGVRIDAAARQVLDATPRPIVTSMSYEERSPVVASDGNNFLVVWRLGNGTLEAGRVRAADGAVLYPFATVGTGSSLPASVTFDGQNYRVGWVGAADGSTKAFSTQVSTSGAVGEQLLLSSTAYTTQADAPAIAATSPGRYLMLYSQNDRTRMRLVREEQPQDCSEQGPTLVLNGPATLNLQCAQGNPYTDPGAQAFDGCGNPLVVHAYNSGADSSGPGPNPGVEGEYTVSYAAWDAQGRTVNASRTVLVEDSMAPGLQLLGAAEMTHTCGSMWNDPGVSAWDACYGSLTHTVWRSGEVNGWAAGTYTVTYSLSDSGGNSAPPLTRTVHVVNCPW